MMCTWSYMREILTGMVKRLKKMWRSESLCWIRRVAVFLWVLLYLFVDKVVGMVTEWNVSDLVFFFSDFYTHATFTVIVEYHYLHLLQKCISYGCGENLTDDFRSSVLYHSNGPRWGETVRVRYCFNTNIEDERYIIVSGLSMYPSVFLSL